jgi:hypothetical protein
MGPQLHHQVVGFLLQDRLYRSGVMAGEPNALEESEQPWAHSLGEKGGWFSKPDFASVLTGAV